MLLPLLLGAAVAAPPVAFDVHLKGDIDFSDANPYQSFGWGVRGGAQVVRRLWFDAGADLGFQPGSRLRLSLYPALRVFLTRPEARWGGVSLRFGAGVDLAFAARTAVRVQPVLLPALGVDLRLFDDLRLRLDAGYVTHLDDAGGLQGQVGVVFVPHREPVVVELAPQPFEESGLVWRGHPTCDWSDRDEAVAFIANAEGGSAGSADRGQTPGEDGGEQQGTLAVVTWPGDHLTLVSTPYGGGAETQRDFNEAPPEGVFFASVAVGEVLVSVRGGGRASEPQTVAVIPGAATWVRFDDPDPYRVHFDVSSSTVRDEARAEVLARAALPGNASWELHGSYSPEGQVDANVRLATARGEAVRDLLVAAGVDPARIRVTAREFPDPDAAAEEKRSVEVIPVARLEEAP